MPFRMTELTVRLVPPDDEKFEKIRDACDDVSCPLSDTRGTPSGATSNSCTSAGTLKFNELLMEITVKADCNPLSAGGLASEAKKIAPKKGAAKKAGVKKAGAKKPKGKS